MHQTIDFELMKPYTLLVDYLVSHNMKGRVVHVSCVLAKVRQAWPDLDAKKEQ